MDTKEKLEQTIDKLEHTGPSPQKHELALKASKIHEAMTGHAMKFDKDDNLVTTGPEAEQCPALHKQ